MSRYVDLTVRVPGQDTFSPDGIWFRNPSTDSLAENKVFVVQKGVNFILSWKGQDYSINELNLVELLEDRLVQTPLTIGIEFRVQNDDRIFKVFSRGIEIIGGGSLVVTEPVITVSASIPPNIPDGRAYILNNNNTLFPGRVMIGRPLAGQIVWEQLQNGSVFMLENRLMWERFDGYRTYPISYPVGVAYAILKNIDLLGFTLKDYLDAADPLRGNPPVISTNGIVSQNIILLGQTNKIENGLWQVRFTNGRFSDVNRLPPYLSGLGYREGETFVEVWRGDTYGGKYLSPFPETISGNGVQTITIGTTAHEWLMVDKDYIEINQLKARVTTVENNISNYSRTYLSNVSDITVSNGDRVLIEGDGNIYLWAAKKDEWFVISDMGNKLKTLTPSVIPTTGYSIEGKEESLELNSVGSEWGGRAHDENTLLFIFDGMTWRVGGQMKLAELFPQTTNPETPSSPEDSTSPRLVLLDEPKVDVKEGNLIVNLRTLLSDEGVSN